MVTIKLNYSDNCNKPESKKGGWYDIPLPYDLYYKKGDIVKIKFDLRIIMPIDYEAIIKTRSSTLERTGLISSDFGVIEYSYCGPDDYIGYRFYATRDGFVSKGTCLCQMRFQERMKEHQIIRATDDEFLNNPNRGGFGSTDSIQTKYEDGFSDVFEEGSLDGYEQGFRDGYDKAIEDLKIRITEQKV